MKNMPSEVNETGDIFVLSRSDTAVTLFTGHLERNGYRVTLFSDTACLLATLRKGKPDLLICDATTLDKDAFEVCRQIKEDDDLWAVPVLILTNASTLSDIFPVLDCKADNFIPLPLDLPFSLSVIESMLRTPVERQTPDQVKTQFGIRHDDRIYGVAASRRKLLEFLLSSFEIAVNRSSELSIVKTELQALSESVHYLEDRVTEQTRLIDTIKATLHQKEQKISLLTSEVEEKKRLLAQKTRKAVIVTYDDNGRTVFHEKKDFGTSSCPDSTTLVQQISGLSQEIDTARSNLETVQEELEEEKIHCTSLECTLELLVQQKEFVEKSLRSLNDEHEQLLSAFEAERNRVISAEQELSTALQAKTQAEQELARTLNEFNEIKNQAADLNQLRCELDREADRRISAENQMGSLLQEKEQSESLLQLSIAALNDQLDDLRVQLKTIRTAFEAGRNRVISAEQELTTTLQAKTQAEQELARIINEFTERKIQQAADLNQLKSELDREAGRRITAENQLGSLLQEKEQSESLLESSTAALKDQLGDLHVQLEAARTALEDEENTTKVLRQNLAEIAAEHERTRMRENEALESDKATLMKQKHDLDEATAMVKTLERTLNTLKIKNKTLVDELNLANQRKPQSDHQLRMIADELKMARTALDTERSLREGDGRSIVALKQTIQRMGQDLRASAEERTRLNHRVENERKNRVLSEDKPIAAIVTQEYPAQEHHAVPEELTSIRKQDPSSENKSEMPTENGQYITGKDTDIRVTDGSPSEAPEILTPPDPQQSPVPAHKLTSFKPSFQITEVSHEAVTDIIDIFSADDSIEEDNLL